MEVVEEGGEREIIVRLPLHGWPQPDALLIAEVVTGNHVVHVAIDLLDAVAEASGEVFAERNVGKAVGGEALGAVGRVFLERQVRLAVGDSQLWLVAGDLQRSADHVSAEGGALRSAQ